MPEPSTTSPSRGFLKSIGLVMRVIVPLLILGVGIFCYLILSVVPEKEKSPPPPPPAIRTRVVELDVTDHVVVVKAFGKIQAHNEVVISSQVSGKVIKVSDLFEPGSQFGPKDVLVSIDKRDYETELDIAKAQKVAAESALEIASREYERKLELKSTSAVADAEIDQAKAAMAQAQFQLDTAVAQIEKTTRDIERTEIKVPFQGRIRTKTVGVGQVVSSGSPLGTVFSVEFAEVRLPISSDEIMYLSLPELPGDPAIPVELRDAINPADAPVVHAEIVRTESVVDENSLETFAIARIPFPFAGKSGQPKLRIGQPVIASIKGMVLKDVVALPRRAVRQLDQIYLIDKEDLTIAGTTITPIWADSENVYVRDPEISNGKLLATTRIVFAPDGAKAEIIPDVESDDDSAEEKVAAH